MGLLDLLNPFRNTGSEAHMPPDKRIDYLLRKGSNDETRRDALKESKRILQNDSTDTAIGKMHRAREWGMLKKDPLVWLNFVLAVHEKFGSSIFNYSTLSDEVNEARDSLKQMSKDSKTNDVAADKVQKEIDREITEKRLFNTRATAPQAPVESPMTAMPPAEMKAANDNDSPNDTSDTQTEEEHVEERKAA